MFGNRHVTPISKTQLMENRYRNARYDLLVIALFTIVNIGFLTANSYTYFLFSASIPYALVDFAMYVCGRYPAEFYEGGYDTYEFFDPTIFYVIVAVAMVIAMLYILFAVLSRKNRVGWLITALVFFSLDTAFLFAYYVLSLDMLIDYIFHAIVIVVLAMGIDAHYKLKRMPQDISEVPESANETDDPAEEKPSRPDSPIMRTADKTVKSRVFVEVKAYGHTIVYRRVKKVNELVIDGYVYGEYIARLEMPHVLTAYVDGHDIAVGYNGNSSYAVIDKQQVASKIRWY